LNFITPSQRHNGHDKAILEQRDHIYQQAKLAHPERWSKDTRNWTLPSVVTLNPNRKAEKQTIRHDDDVVLAA